jgi:demethylmenaquinone methyltransferase/2-methoxy-6-polyprenyl-1,4-benzoquinol methylase
MPDRRPQAPAGTRKKAAGTAERQPERTASFGFKDVPENLKATLVKDVFDRVVDKYDLMNDLMSLGVHRRWKQALIDWLKPRPAMALVDVGGGTGDIAFLFRDRGGGPVTVVDVNEEMIHRGRDRAIDRGVLGGIAWVCGDAEALPIADQAADAYTTAFCIRNVTRIDAALHEAYRVLKPGGRFLCLEFSQVTLPVLDALYDAYSFRVLPALGELVAGDRDAYQYLAESIRRFPNQEAFAAMIRAAGFGQVKVRNLSGGIAALHSGWRL